MSTMLIRSPNPAPAVGAGTDASHVQAARRAVAPRALATLLLAAGVAALAVVTDRLIVTWADGHLLAAWVLMWAVVFLGSLLLASPARHAAQRVMAGLNGWALRRAVARAEARTAALAQRDARLQAELNALRQRMETPEAAWAHALSPLGPEPTSAAHSLREWTLSQAEQMTWPNCRRYSFYYV